MPRSDEAETVRARHALAAAVAVAATNGEFAEDNGTGLRCGG
eukprot:CAMPEP_0113598522 /NCGR_PEP_ID=MMETSP0015_2-20120614/41639_1 /TAXON_ID=2838 /ORGANISM="Odontella" /LENGTH=41 /DNA_ID=CAMNT_0000506559 /DNA_START=66 /DNA_END=187 /DNA_ORIENTATION=- /assembly_acc=CAM_ASM_000160